MTIGPDIDMRSRAGSRRSRRSWRVRVLGVLLDFCRQIEQMHPRMRARAACRDVAARLNRWIEEERRPARGGKGGADGDAAGD